ncbi:MAG: T9SS type A sorting domain-containing protein [Bradymonadaceae bacterium]|nr:T9SS type A sorting domain-containing protein [Lujinxingiaceae bacterium]
MKSLREYRRFHNVRGILSTTASVAIALCLLVAFESSAEARDPDGTRMQARKVALGATHATTLAPPTDAADWRYIQLKEGVELTIEVSSEPKTQVVKVTLTTATGDELTAASSQGGRLKITRNLDPGIYYISIQSGDAVSYRMTIR